jgi:hypothetical protein
MFRLSGGVFEGGGDIAVLQKRVVLKDLLAASTRRKETEHIGHAHAYAAQAWASTALLCVDGDAVKLAHDDLGVR